MNDQAINVTRAATRIRRFLRDKNGGTMPRSMRGWQVLCELLNVDAGPLEHEHPNFTARLFYDEDLDGWGIVYNPTARARQVRRYLCHELAEYVAVSDYPNLFDNLPRRAYSYTGGNDPDDARHRIARRVEQLCFRK